jgi:hypothetical protein
MSAISSAGALSRAMCELGLTNVEQQRMLRNNNVVTSKFMSEKDARSQEFSEQNDKAVDLAFKKIAAKNSEKAALYGVIGAALNLLGTAIKGATAKATGAPFNFATFAADAVNGLGTVVSKYLDYLKAGEERKSVEEDMRRLNGQRAQTDESVQALDANPYA